MSKHGVSPKDVHECFENRDGGLLEDDREEHRTDPTTLWFIADNSHNRSLKVCFVFREDVIYLRTCYPPNRDEVLIYNRNGRSP